MLILSFGFYESSHAQYYGNYSQFISNDHVINPAYAGADDALSLTFLGRSQWAGVDGAPTTQSFTGHTLFKNEKTGVGVTLINDEVGVHRSLTSLATYAYRIKLENRSNGYLSFGLQFGAISRKSDYSSLDPEDPLLVGLSERNTSFAFGTGIYYKSQSLNLCLSVPNLLSKDPGYSVDGNSGFTNSEYLLVGRYKIPVSHNLTLIPAGLIKYFPDLPLSYNITLAGVINEALLVGTGYSSSKTANIIIQANLSQQLKMGYSYEFSLSNQYALPSNTHELMINFLFKYKNSKAPGPR